VFAAKWLLPFHDVNGTRHNTKLRIILKACIVPGSSIKSVDGISRLRRFATILFFELINLFFNLLLEQLKLFDFVTLVPVVIKSYISLVKKAISLLSDSLS